MRQVSYCRILRMEEYRPMYRHLDFWTNTCIAISPKTPVWVGALQDDLFWNLKIKAPSHGFPGVAVLAMENWRVSNKLNLSRAVPMCFISSFSQVSRF